MKHIIWTTGHELLLENIITACNCDLFDSNGTKYIDLESGVWCTSIGHSHPRINQTINSQISKISHTGFNYSNPIIEEAALRILEMTNLPGGKCEFLCSGSEAVEFCMRLANALMSGKKFLTFSDSYYGAYGEATKMDSKNWIRHNWQDCSCKSHGDGCQANCSEFLKIPFDQIGVFLFEPGSSSGLVNFPSEKLISGIINKIKQNKGIVIVNEVTTGVGRTGKWFGFQHYKINPDLVAIGKGIGNGYPVSVAAISRRIIKLKRIIELIRNDQFHYSQSHQNDPLGASIAKEVIDTILSEKLIDRGRKLGEKIIGELKEVQAHNPIIKEIRGRGLMIAIEFTKDAKLIQHELLKRGFIVAKRSGMEVLRIDPALTIKEEDIDAFIETLKKIIQ